MTGVDLGTLRLHKALEDLAQRGVLVERLDADPRLLLVHLEPYAGWDLTPQDTDELFEAMVHAAADWAKAHQTENVCQWRDTSNRSTQRLPTRNLVPTGPLNDVGGRRPPLLEAAP